MRIAVFLVNDDFPDNDVIQAYAFTVEKEIITAIASETLSVKNIKYLLIWLLGKSIEVLYTNNCNEEDVKKIFERVGIRLRSLNEIKDNPLLKDFIVEDK